MVRAPQQRAESATDDRHTSPVAERMTIEGFTFHMPPQEWYCTGEDTLSCPGPKWMAKITGGLAAGLRHYKSRARKVWPRLASMKVPLRYHHNSPDHRQMHASYNTRTGSITIFSEMFRAKEPRPEEFAKTFAHEMAHHVWRTILSEQDKRMWSEVVYGRLTELPILQAIRHVKNDWVPVSGSSDFRRKDPIGFMQFQGFVRHHPEVGKMTRSELREYGREHGVKTLQVHAKPITGYASMSPEESFAEAFGLLMGFGPRTVLPQVRASMRAMLPSMKINESVSEGMRGLLERLEMQFGEPRWVLGGKQLDVRVRVGGLRFGPKRARLRPEIRAHLRVLQSRTRPLATRVLGPDGRVCLVQAPRSRKFFRVRRRRWKVRYIGVEPERVCSSHAWL